MFLSRGGWLMILPLHGQQLLLWGKKEGYHPYKKFS